MMRVFTELRAAKFYLPREWDVERNIVGTERPSREQDPALDISARPRWTSIQEAEDIVAAADQRTGYMSDADILGVELFGKPTEVPVYRKIQLPNYAGSAFRSAMAIVDAAFNRPLVLSADNVVVDPTADVQRTPPSPPEVNWRLTVRVGRDDCPVRGRWCSPPPERSWPSELEAGTADRLPQSKVRRRTLWCRIKRFVGDILLCCGTYDASDVSEEMCIFSDGQDVSHVRGK